MKDLMLWAALMCLLSGCSGGGTQVTGKVTLDDGSAAPRGQVTFRNPAGSYHGGIQPDGTYMIENVPNGDYSVAVVGVMDSEGDEQAGMAYNDETGEYIQSDVPQPKSLIKEIYSDPEKSGLTLSVPGSYDLKVDRATGGGAADGSS